MTAQESMPLSEDPVGSAITAAGSTRGTPTRIPADRYRSPEFAAREIEKMWPRVWQIACSVDHVSDPGDFFEYRVAHYSVLIVRGRDGELRAFQNVCRHRGNVICTGAGKGLRNLRCAYHGWTYSLKGELQGVPSRKGFGDMDRSSLGLPPVQVDTWGPLVFVNLDSEAPPLLEYLEGVPADIEWVGLDAFRCTHLMTMKAPANWKLVADGFSETYHVQTLHREMLASIDDINSRQHIWGHHGVSHQRYGVPSPRLKDPGDQVVWDSFVFTQGERAGVSEACEAPPVPEGQTMQEVIAQRIRDHKAQAGVDLSHFDTDQILELHQYNLFPNATVLVNADILQILAALPGPTPDEATLVSIGFNRAASADAPRSDPPAFEADIDEADFGSVLNQDVALLRNAQRGVHQPGFTHLNLSSEEIRIINMHRNLERYLGIEPSEMLGGPLTG